MKKKYALQCGAGQVDITPKIGAILYGYAPGRPAQSVGDGLQASAIKLVSNEGGALLITCAIASMSPELSTRLRKAAGEVTGIKPENVICNQSVMRQTSATQRVYAFIIGEEKVRCVVACVS